MPRQNNDNPFFTASPLFLKAPAFDQIKHADFAPAFTRGMAEQQTEILSISNQQQPPTFENTLIAIEKSGTILNRVSKVFFNLVSANTNDKIEALRTQLAPKLSAHKDQTWLNNKLFKRVEILHKNKDSMGLDAESRHLIEQYFKQFIRSGAQLSSADQKQLKALNAELATLGTTFTQNVQKEVNASVVIVDAIDRLGGLSENTIATAAKAATDLGLQGKYAIGLVNTSNQPLLASLNDRALREQVHHASLQRGSHGGKYDNRETLSKIIKLRAQRAQLLGYENYAAYVLEARMAKNPLAVNELLAGLAAPAVNNAQQEQADLQTLLNSQNTAAKLAAWDWSYYSEKVRQTRYDYTESQLKPYFELNNVLQLGVFYAANQLYGLTFKERHDLPVYQTDVRVWEVFDADGSTLALFYGDFYARSNKRGGAWMNSYVSQSNLLNDAPVIANHLNIIKPPTGQATLLTFDEVITLFHEFGHALHGMLSDVEYPYFSGTSVPRDFVEFPSQVNEMWATWSEVIKNYAIHYQTGKAIPDELLSKVLASQKFNQGFATTEYLAASLLDQAWHQLDQDSVPNADGVLSFEANALAKAGVAMQTIPPRYRSTYFSHIMGGYGAGYYSYVWSEVLDADSVAWFEENGGMTRENGAHFRHTLLSRGGSADAMSLFTDFRGAKPDIQHLLKRKGLSPKPLHAP